MPRDRPHRLPNPVSASKSSSHTPRQSLDLAALRFPPSRRTLEDSRPGMDPKEQGCHKNNAQGPGRLATRPHHHCHRRSFNHSRPHGRRFRCRRNIPMHIRALPRQSGFP